MHADVQYCIKGFPKLHTYIPKQVNSISIWYLHIRMSANHTKEWITATEPLTSLPGGAHKTNVLQTEPANLKFKDRLHQTQKQTVEVNKQSLKHCYRATTHVIHTLTTYIRHMFSNSCVAAEIYA